ncbi:MAG: class I SAM-dependent methyltransferase [Candidatus Rokuibacteriota bacterium]
MPTHQSLTGSSDEDLLQRMIATHAERFEAAFWAFFSAHVGPRLPARAVVVDLGCGPGLLLRDIGDRHPDAMLYGYDVTHAMIDYGRRLTFTAAGATFALHDVATTPLPHASGTVHLASMSSVLHVFDEPLPAMAEIRRVLAPGGIFLLNDWVRQSLATYLAWRRDVMKETGPDGLRRAFRLFPVQNKYTPEDWRWLLGEAGFEVLAQIELRASHRIFVATPTR